MPPKNHRQPGANRVNRPHYPNAFAGAPANRMAPDADPHPMPDLRERIQIWVNEGGAGGEVGP